MNKLSDKQHMKEKNSYVAVSPDWWNYAYFILAFSFISFLATKFILNQNIPSTLLIAAPAMIGILLILFYLPVMAIMFIVTESAILAYLSKLKRESAPNTAIIIAKGEWWRPSYWRSPNYGIDLLLLIKFLKAKNQQFMVVQNATIETVDNIMKDSSIKAVYLVGHGRRHGFVLDTKTTVDYCRYDGKAYQKEFVYQIHCNHGGGKSLVEYVVPSNNQQECLPEHGYMSSATISRMFIDKIVSSKNLVGFRAVAYKKWLSFLTMVPYFVSLLIMGTIFNVVIQ